MSIGRIARYCAALAFTLTLSGIASAEGATVNADPCPPSHGASGSGYRDMLVRLQTEPAPATSPRTTGVTTAGGYRDSAARFSNAERTGPLDSPRKIVGGGYRDSLARFPGTFSSESPQHAMLRCGRLDSI
jgi:hypothetical protein